MAWHEWHPQAGVIAGIALAALWYFVGLRRYLARSTRGHRVALKRSRYYIAALAVLLMALASPLEAAADALFSIHMVQHLLLILVVAPLIAMAAPAAALWWGMPPALRTPADRLWARRPQIRRAWHLVTAPAVVLVAHVAALWFWHFPAPYQAALGNEWLHALEHISFLATAIMFWWIVLQPVGHRRISRASGGAFLMIALLQGGLLGALLVFARAPWYPVHAAESARWGVELLRDQQVAGLLMWIPASVVYLGAIAYLAHAALVSQDADRPSPFGRQTATLPAGIFPS